MHSEPIPRLAHQDFIDELIDQLGPAEFIGYWQVPEDKSNTAFIPLFELFQFNVKPFGFQGAQAYISMNYGLCSSRNEII